MGGCRQLSTFTYRREACESGISDWCISRLGREVFASMGLRLAVTHRRVAGCQKIFVLQGKRPSCKSHEAMVIGVSRG